LERRPGERDVRYAHLLTGEVDDVAPERPEAAFGDRSGGFARPAADDRAGELAAEVAELRRRLDRLEHLLGVEPAVETSDEP
jgi:uncharacterized protein YceH (UPF0502 family)